jgi:hypothetical protein
VAALIAAGTARMRPSYTAAAQLRRASETPLETHVADNKVVILDGDFTSDGLPSIRLFSDTCIVRVLEHLWKLGHRHIDCLNTQNRNPEIDRRIGIWRQWLDRKKCNGSLHDDPAPVFTIRRSLLTA